MPTICIRGLKIQEISLDFDRSWLKGEKERLGIINLSFDYTISHGI